MRLRASSTGYTGAPGLYTFYFTTPTEEPGDAVLASVRVRALLVELAKAMTTSTVLTLLPQVDLMDPATGDVTGSFIISGAAIVPVPGTGGSQGLPPQAALLIQWRSSEFEAGRRLTGRTFVSPLVTTTALATADSVPAPGIRTTLQTAVTAYLDNGGGSVDAVVWRRPRPARTLPTPQSARPGRTAVLTSATIGTKFATLNSRRD